MPPMDNQYKIRNQEFLQEYAQRPGVKTMFNGVMYRVINKGNGPKPSPKSYVTVYYTGKLINGKVFDQTQKGRRQEERTICWNMLWLMYRTADHPCIA